jgi:hypothetical protein
MKKKVKDIREKARQKVYEEVKKPKPKKEKTKVNPTTPQAKWFPDPLGDQGEVFFDGYNYWLTKIPPKIRGEPIRKVYFIKLNPKQWEERNRKKNENGRNSSDS